MKRVLVVTTLLVSALAANAALYLRPEARVRVPEGNALVQIGAQKLSVSRALMRDPAQMSGGPLDRLDLVLAMDTLQPLPPPDAKAPEKTVPERLGIVLSSGENGMSSIDMFGRVYARFLSGEKLPNPAGLMLRRFRENSPYQDRELYLGIGTGRTFVALCPMPEARAQEPCTTTFRLAGMDMELRFDARHLPQWRRFTQAALTLAASLPLEARPVEARPVEARPVEARPVEARPVGSRQEDKKAAAP